MLSHYRLVEKIGEGGMGVVWRAEDTVLNRAVAIKVISADAAFDDARRPMFLEEARLLSSVNDAHIVQIYELGREGCLDFIVNGARRRQTAQPDPAWPSTTAR
jgi:serine/threonine protein kinase